MFPAVGVVTFRLKVLYAVPADEALKFVGVHGLEGHKFCDSL